MYDQRTITYVGATNISENTHFAKYNSTPKFVDLQYISMVISFCTFQVLAIVMFDPVLFQVEHLFVLLNSNVDVRSNHVPCRNKTPLCLQNSDFVLPMTLILWKT